MAFTSVMSQAVLRLSSLLDLKQKFTFTDLESAPSTTVDWNSALAFSDLDLTKVGPTAPNPVEQEATEGWGDLITGIAGAHTVDLTALPRSAELGNLDLTGLALQGFLLAAPFANTDPVTIVPGATNGYNLQNSATNSITIAPGGVEMCFYPENMSKTTGMPDVAVADAELDLSSAMANFQLLVVLWAG